MLRWRKEILSLAMLSVGCTTRIHPDDRFQNEAVSLERRVDLIPGVRVMVIDGDVVVVDSDSRSLAAYARAIPRLVNDCLVFSMDGDTSRQQVIVPHWYQLDYQWGYVQEIVLALKAGDKVVAEIPVDSWVWEEIPQAYRDFCGL